MQLTSCCFLKRFLQVFIFCSEFPLETRLFFLSDLFLLSKSFLLKKKWSRYRPGVAQRVGRGIALFFHGRGTRRWWVVSSTPRPHSTPGKDPVPILQETGWAPGQGWTSGKSRPHRDSIRDRPARSSVTTLTELPGPQLFLFLFYNIFLCCVSMESLECCSSIR